MDATITGGTGRYRHARGTFTLPFAVTPYSSDATTITNRVEGDLNGRLTY